MLDNIARTFEDRFTQLKMIRGFRAIKRNDPPILFVHQMGKVGSTALVESLRNAKGPLTWRVQQTHFLSPEGMAFVEGLESDAFGGWRKTPRSKRSVLSRNRTMSRRIANGDYGQFNVKVISLVRDPVATNLSGFFFNYPWWPDDLTALCKSKAPGWESALLDRFLGFYPHEVPAKWFDMEMNGVFGVDVFASEFNKRAGYQVYEDQQFPLLLLRLESFGEETEEAIKAYLELEQFSFQRSNEASDKWYADLYRRFKRTVPLPAGYLDQIYDTPFAKQFYNEVEIARFRDRWERPESLVFDKKGSD